MLRRLIVLGDLRRFAFLRRAMSNLLRKEAYNYHSNDSAGANCPSGPRSVTVALIVLSF